MTRQWLRGGSSPLRTAIKQIDQCVKARSSQALVLYSLQSALCLDENRDVYTALCTAGGGGGSRLCRDVRREGPHKRQSEGGEASTLL